MTYLYDYLNMVLSLAVGASIGYLWAVKTKRPRTLWATVVIGIAMALSPIIMKDVKLIWANGHGLIGSYTVMGLTTVITIMAIVRLVRRDPTPLPTTSSEA